MKKRKIRWDGIIATSDSWEPHSDLTTDPQRSIVKRDKLITVSSEVR
jgi:hypothetical protein